MIFSRGYFADSYKIREGCPIIQNGKLIGAVTHVMINDPTVGYGIFIENMLIAGSVPSDMAA